jgi:hypothetical protein
MQILLAAAGTDLRISLALCVCEMPNILGKSPPTAHMKPEDV